MNLNSIAQIIEGSNNIVFFGGAGMSTESGIADFRSENGLYRTASGYEYPPEKMLSHSFFRAHTEDFYKYYKEKMLFPNALPNDGHKALAYLEDIGRLQAVITQNIDGLHQLAGSKKVFELHGSIHRNYCTKCHAFYKLEYIINCDKVPYCSECNGLIKPDVVLYEEQLDDSIVSGAIRAIQQAEILIIGGTSLAVYPTAGLLNYFRGNKTILINKSQTPYDSRADLVLHDSVGKVLGAAAGITNNE